MINKLRQQHPDDPGPEVLEGSLALARQDIPAAISHFQAALKKDPDHLQALNNAAWLLRETDPSAALQLARRAAKLSQDPEVIDTLGVVLMNAGHYRQAAAVLATAAKRRPRSDAIALNLAEALARSGQQQRAIALLQVLSAKQPPIRDHERAQTLLHSLQASPVSTTP